jgi:hypothetical protein
MIPIISGMGQTAIEYVDSADQERMRDEILTLLGLTHVPKARTQSPHYLQQLEELRSKANHTVSSSISIQFLFQFNIWKNWLKKLIEHKNIRPIDFLTTQTIFLKPTVYFQ